MPNASDESLTKKTIIFGVSVASTRSTMLKCDCIQRRNEFQLFSTQIFCVLVNVCLRLNGFVVLVPRSTSTTHYV